MPGKTKKGTLTKSYKQQHGLHHKHSDKYIKVYWPYLPVLLVVIVGITASIIILFNKPTSSVASTAITAPSLLTQTNQVRSASSQKPLQLNYDLNTAAQEKANDLASYNYWSAISPSGQSPWQLIKSSGYPYQTAGENMAYGFNSSKALLSAWVSSPGHKSNIVNGNFDEVGFGIAHAPDFRNQGPQTIVVALYASTNVPTIKTDNSGAFTSASLSQPTSVAITRAESITNKSGTLTIFITGLIAGSLVCFLVIRHSLVFKKWAVEGEELIIKHPVVDLIIVVLLVGVAILNQTVGFIS